MTASCFNSLLVVQLSAPSEALVRRGADLRMGVWSRRGKLHGKEWGIAVTTGGAAEAYGSEGYNRYTVEELTRPYEVTASLVGAIYLPVFTVHNAMQLTDEKLRRHAEDFARYVTGAVRTR